MRSLLALVALATALSCVPSLAGELTPQESRGKEIFLHGRSVDGDEVVAVMGEGEFEIPAEAMTCGSCHGKDGRGRPEGGLRPTNLTWSNLTKSYGLEHKTGRKHPPYDERLFRRAVTMGIDPAGNRLNAAMPRYRMTREDADALLAYVKRLGSEIVDGVSVNRIRIGTVTDESDEPMMHRALSAYIEEINRGGGVYGREIELVRCSFEGAPGEIDRYLDDERPFALVLPVVGQLDELIEASRTRGVPVLAASSGSGEHVYRLLPDLVDRARVLIEFMVASGATSISALTVEPESPHVPFSELLGHEGVQLNVELVGNDIAEALSRSRAFDEERLLVLGSRDDLERTLVALSATDWSPQILFPLDEDLGALAGLNHAQPLQLLTTAVLLPWMPDNLHAGHLELKALASEHALGEQGQFEQRIALAAGKLLVETLRRAGRELDRERWLTTLESLYDFRNGFTPPVTFGPNRRVAARGAYVVQADLSTGQARLASDWIELR